LPTTGWPSWLGGDREILKIELQGLAALDLGFDLEITGFETAELDFLLEDRVEATKPDPADEILPVAPGPSITRPGDLWLMANIAFCAAMPGETVFAFGRGLDARDRWGACAQQHRVHAKPAVAE
jgi:hypothetical protein